MIFKLQLCVCRGRRLHGRKSTQSIKVNSLLIGPSFTVCPHLLKNYSTEVTKNRKEGECLLSGGYFFIPDKISEKQKMNNFKK